MYKKMLAVCSAGGAFISTMAPAVAWLDPFGGCGSPFLAFPWMGLTFVKAYLSLSSFTSLIPFNSTGWFNAFGTGGLW